MAGVWVGPAAGATVKPSVLLIVFCARSLAVMTAVYVPAGRSGASTKVLAGAGTSRSGLVVMVSVSTGLPVADVPE